MASPPEPRLPAELETPEFHLLAACSCYMQHAWPAQRRRIEAALAEQPDVQRFTSLVERHRLPVLVETVLARTARDSGDEPAVLAGIKDSSRRSRLLNLVFHGELLRLQAAFAASGIPLLPMKGTLLSQRLYGDIGLRQMKDIDLLVTPADLENALALLEALGYHVNLPPALRRGRSFQLVRKVWWHLECVDQKTGVMVELHWRFEHIYSTALNQLWWPWLNASGAERDRYELLYLCMHGAGHGWSRFKWLGDVAVLLDRLNTEEEWPALEELAGKLRLEPILAQTLMLLQRLCGLQLHPVMQAYEHSTGVTHCRCWQLPTPIWSVRQRTSIYAHQGAS